MTQRQLDQAVAKATGETVREIQRLGFSIADPPDPLFDPEYSELDRYLDWDLVDLQRHSLLPAC